MVFLPGLQGIDLSAFQVSEKISAVLEAQRKVEEFALSFPTEDLFAVHQEVMALPDIQPTLPKIYDAVQVYNYKFSAIAAAQELARQQQQIMEAVEQFQPAVDIVQQLNTRQWTMVTGAAGLSASATTPLWTTVPAAAPPIETVAAVITGAAGETASMMMDIAVYHLENTLSDNIYRNGIAWILVTIIVSILEQKPPVSAIESWSARLMLILGFIYKFLFSTEG